MFERFKIYGALSVASHECRKGGDAVDDKLIQNFVRPFIDIAIKDMKRIGLDGDQAACALIISTTESLYKQGHLKKLENDEPTVFQSLFTIYCYFYNRMSNNPERYVRAEAMHDTETFKKILMI